MQKQPRKRDCSKGQQLSIAAFAAKRSKPGGTVEDDAATCDQQAPAMASCATGHGQAGPFVQTDAQHQQQRERETPGEAADQQPQQQDDADGEPATKQLKGRTGAAAKAPARRGNARSNNAPAAAAAVTRAERPRAAKSAAAAAAAVKDNCEGEAVSGGGSEEEDEPAAAPGSSSDEEAGAAATGAAAAAAAGSASFDAEEIAHVNQALLAWYDRVQRVLPWRRNPFHKPQQPSQQQQQPAAQASSSRGSKKGAGGAARKPSKVQAAAAEAAAALAAAKPAPADLDPQGFAYYVWVSEIMLQQTQVARVIGYFNKWIEKWPTVAALSVATQEEVNEVWAGLGYYRRAKYLLEGSRFIMQQLGGKFPETAAGLRVIPGVGPYTAAAVASIAFNDRAAAVDGNVIRVLARLRTLRGNPAKASRLFDQLAAQLLHPERPGCHNQAMMELGATVCKPVGPLCGSCPVATVCSAAKQVAAYAAAGGCPDVEEAPRVTDYPEKVAKPTKHEQHVATCVVKLLLLPDADVAAAAAAAAGGTSNTKPRKSAAAGAAAGASGSIRSFFEPQPKQQAGAAAAAAGSSEAGGQQPQAPLSESALVAAGASVQYLLVQRPDSGLLAGLWEFPGVVLSGEQLPPSPGGRRAAVDGFLTSGLGLQLPGSSSSSSNSGEVTVVHRRQLGSVVHIFSHIRQTLHAEELVLLASSLEAVCGADGAAGSSSSSAAAAAAVNGKKETGAAGGKVAAGKAKGKRRRGQADGGDDDGDDGCDAAAGEQQQTAQRPGLRWVLGSDMLQQGLTGGVRKVLQLALK